MDRDEYGRQLHDRATRGEALTVEEQVALSVRYEEQDRTEAAVLAESHEGAALAALRTQVRAGVQQLRAVTQRIEELTEENDRLRQEIAASQRQLALVRTAHPA